MDGGQIYNKPKIVEEGPDKKKKKKGLNKTFNKQTIGNQTTNEKVDSISEETQKILNKIQEYCPSRKRQKILQLMKAHNNNIQIILNKLLESEQQQVKSPTKQTNNSKSQALKIEDTYFGVFDEEVQINKNQFQSLFEEISLIIQQTDISLMEKNHMIENCKDQLDQFVKITVGFQEQLNIDDIDYDDFGEKEVLLREIQLFIEEVSKQRNEVSKRAKFKNTQQQFPTLGGGRSTTKGPNIIQKLNNEYKKNQIQSNKMFQKRTQYFDIQNKPVHKQQKNSHFFLSQNQNPLETNDIKLLAKQYEYMEIKQLKIIYSLLGDLETCKRFLKEFYREYKSQKRKIQTIILAEKPIPKPVFQESYENKQTINSEVMKLSFDDLRQFINHQMKLKVVFKGASSKMSNYNQKKKLQFFANQYNSILNQYMKASKYKFLEKAKQQNMNQIDLHGFFVNEAIDITQAHIENVYREYKNGSIKLIHKYRNGKALAEIMIITGKGLHSRNRKSVLKPAIIKYCESKGIPFQDKEGGILMKIQLN